MTSSASKNSGLTGLRHQTDSADLVTTVEIDGLIPYVGMWERQQQLAESRLRDQIGDTLLLLEHEHVYTNGWRGDRANLLADEETLRRINASYHVVERGGDITYHGPGQLVAYPIINLRSFQIGVREYIERLEAVVSRTLDFYGVQARTIPGLIGVWVGDAKIAAVGVKVRRGVAYHGFALNVDPDLEYFSHIVPCGLEDAKVTSMSALRNQKVPVSDVRKACMSAFAEVFDVRLHPGSDVDRDFPAPHLYKAAR